MKTKKYSDINKYELETYTGIVLYTDGSKAYLVKGKYHRADGPAYESPNGDKRWYTEGVKHRLDGPAVEYSYMNEWWYKGNLISVKSQEDFEKYLITLVFE